MNTNKTHTTLILGIVLMIVSVSCKKQDDFLNAYLGTSAIVGMIY